MIGIPESCEMCVLCVYVYVFLCMLFLCLHACVLVCVFICVLVCVVWHALRMGTNIGHTVVEELMAGTFCHFPYGSVL